MFGSGREIHFDFLLPSKPVLSLNESREFRQFLRRKLCHCLFDFNEAHG